MAERLLDSRALKWVLVATVGPVTGPLAIVAIRYARAGDRLGALAYLAAIPAVWTLLSALAVVSWTS